MIGTCYRIRMDKGLKKQRLSESERNGDRHRYAYLRVIVYRCFWKYTCERSFGAGIKKITKRFFYSPPAQF
jgi:hypothetical protein